MFHVMCPLKATSDESFAVFNMSENHRFQNRNDEIEIQIIETVWFDFL